MYPVRLLIHLLGHTVLLLIGPWRRLVSHWFIRKVVCPGPVEFCNRSSHILRLVIRRLPISRVVSEEVVKREELLRLWLLHCLLGEHFLILRCRFPVLRWRHSELLLVCLLTESWHILLLIGNFPLLWAAVLECRQRLVKLSGWPILVGFVSPC